MIVYAIQENYQKFGILLRYKDVWCKVQPYEIQGDMTAQAKPDLNAGYSESEISSDPLT